LRQVVIRAGELSPREEKPVARPQQSVSAPAGAPIQEPVVVLDADPRAPFVGQRAATNTPGGPSERPHPPRRQRDFLIRYDGAFIGHYHATKPVLPRLAFGQIARELKHKLPGFDPALLELFRPVKLRVLGVARAVAEAAGDFSWFDRSPAARGAGRESRV